MKKSWKYLVGASLGIGAYALYMRYNHQMMHGLKNSIDKMSKNATKSIENMM